MKKTVTMNDIAAFEGAANQAIAQGAKAMEVPLEIIQHYQGHKYDKMFFNYKGLTIIQAGMAEEIARQQKITMEQLVHRG